MKKVLLLGDSIRMGYDDYVKKFLKGKCEVYYDAEDNGRFASYTLWQANQFFRTDKFDVVHWNNGYWDMNVEAPMTEAMHPVDEYVHYLKRIIKEIRRNGAEIIYATCAPIGDAGSSKDNSGTRQVIFYDNDSVIKYNDAAKKLMAEENITVNDLYSVLYNKEKNFYKCEDHLHLTEEGYRLCAENAAKLILEKINK